MEKNHHWDFRELENAIMRAYLEMQSTNSAKSKADLYTAIKDITFGILMVGNYSQMGLNYEDVSYEYSVYLFERLVTKKFVPVYRDRFPWNKYIVLNLKHIIYSKFIVNDNTVCGDICDLLSDNHADLIELHCDTGNRVDHMTSEYSIKKIYDWLRMFYSEHEIQRLFPISREYLLSYGLNFTSSYAPKDVIEFTKVLISISKRIIYSGVNNDYKIYKKSDLNGFVDSSLKSTLFLASVINSNFFPIDLLLSCDLDSLLRLITISGGSTIHIPTIKEFDTVIGATVAASKMIIGSEKCKDIIYATWEAKCENNLVFSHKVNMNNLISKVLESCKLSSDEDQSESSPLIYLLLSSIKSLSTISENLHSKVDESSFSELVSNYDKIVDLTLKLIATLSPNNLPNSETTEGSIEPLLV